MRENIDFQDTLKIVIEKLKEVNYNNGDISDLGNEIGISVGSVIKDMNQEDISNFIVGIKHGISLTNNTH